MLFTLITEANFLVILIALLVIFFLLGIILGNILTRPRKTPNDQNTDLIKEIKENPPQVNALGQDNQENIKPDPNLGQNRQPGAGGYKYYRWW
jgi:preprotein translocase subunit SecG